ncbi:AAC(3)-I family aminoglycoside 3-N-acetyltransferase [Leptospira levettii]|uniref:GNAT family N-acetyltransferase n=1 Tax=Leptospira levettii TaxID=2023178 RepID=UPI000C2A8298|nr:GNAT family N-acetyltransferase [Leptospira levettii]PJZ38422.1 AAC(3)-I family aminoglycoside 3-N-acetyltransferase [Leptospira levettii]PJZ86708.1 AAC(3)-I family aminoglycoside 3-N-acetyltransferase [Leptospira levettii]PKA01757.1 AAC(3)-I family aminoglycoside 3-N-acetyltransferase [Leptospira levettii]
MLPVETKKLSANELKEFIELILVFEDVFEMKEFQMPNQAYLQSLLERDDFFVFVSVIEGKVVAGLTAYLLRQYYSEKPLVYIYDLAVQTHLQRKGIGKSLIASINSYCKEKGMEEVFVQADLADDYALDFYKSTGGRAEDVVHFYYPLN